MSNFRYNEGKSLIILSQKKGSSSKKKPKGDRIGKKEKGSNYGLVSKSLNSRKGTLSQFYCIIEKLLINLGECFPRGHEDFKDGGGLT